MRIANFLLIFLEIFFCFTLVGCSNKQNIAIVQNHQSDIQTEESIMKTYNFPDENKSSNNVIVNEIDGTDNDLLFVYTSFNLKEESFKEMTRDDVLDYFGITLDISDILPDLQEDPDSHYGFYSFGDGSLFEEESFVYQSDRGQIVTIILYKKKVPISSIMESYTQEMEISEIAGHDVIILHLQNHNDVDTYYAKFAMDDLGVIVIAKNMALNDFIILLEYAVQL